jgi:hypothetical protein
MGGFVRGGGFRGGFGHGGFIGGGFRGGPGFRHFGFGNRFFGGGFGGWPVFVGGYGYGDPFYSWGAPYYSSYYSSPYYPYYSNPNVTVVYPAPAASSPVIVSEAPRSVTHEYREEYARAQPLYLIAFTDGLIQAAIAYWVDGSTLHYVTRERREKTAPLKTVDKAFSELLNRDMRLNFSLP